MTGSPQSDVCRPAACGMDSHAHVEARTLRYTKSLPKGPLWPAVVPMRAAVVVPV